MFKRPLYLLNALAAIMAASPVKDKSGNVLAAGDVVMNPGFFRGIRRAYRAARGKTYGAHAVSDDFKPGSIQREIVQAALDNRVRNGALLREHAAYWPQMRAA